jgi:predicted DNA-binding protein
MAKNAAAQVTSFRLPKRLDAKLGEAAEQVGVSRGTYARLVVIEALTDTDQARLRDDLAALRDAVRLLQRNLETAVVALLVDAGRAELDDAEAFVRRQMGRPVTPDRGT